MPEQAIVDGSNGVAPTGTPDPAGNGAVRFSWNLPPVVVTGAATDVDAHSAVLNGTVTPYGNLYADVVWHFSYAVAGNTGGTETADNSLAAGAAPIAVSRDVSGLTPGTLYDYTLVALGPGGTATGTTGQFRTPAAAPRPPEAGAPSGPTLPHTGAPTELLTALGAGLLAGGSVLRFSARRRRARD